MYQTEKLLITFFMKIIFLTFNEYLIVFCKHFQIYSYLKNSGNDDEGLFQSIIYLQRSSSNSEWRDLTWTTCADGCNIEDGFKNQRCVVIGTRSGGISLYVLPTLDSVSILFVLLNYVCSYVTLDSRKVLRYL